MIQSRPHQDDAAFPPFTYEDVAPESVDWLDDVTEEKSTTIPSRQQRPDRKIPAASPPPARKLSRVKPRKSNRSRATAALPTKPRPTPSGSLRRIAPRHDARSEKRRLRLRRLQDDAQAAKREAVVGQAVSLNVAAESAVSVPDVKPDAILPAPVRSVARTVAASSSSPSRALLPTSQTQSHRSAPALSQRPKKTRREKHTSTFTKQPQTGSQDHDTTSVDDLKNESDTAGSYRVVEPEPPGAESYSQWFQRVVARNRVMTWFAAFYVHWIILLLMAVIVVHGPENAASLLLNASIADDEPREVPPMEIIPAIAEPLPVNDIAEVPIIEQSSSAELSEQDIAIDESLLAELTQQIPESTSPSEARKDRTSRQQQRETQSPPIPNPAPMQAVSAGSFSVWTKPTQPSAGDPYHIIIQIRLPEGVDRYDVSDLQGIVVGSDGYRKPIPGSASGELFINDRYARFIVPIVSADAEVHDTIFIKSRLLKETQKITLSF